MFYTEKDMKKVAIIEKYIIGVVRIEDVAGKMWCNIRTAYRKIKAYRERGPSGLLHWLKWRSSNNKSNNLCHLEHYANLKKYKGFGPTLFAEEMEELFGISIHPEMMRRKMIERWCWLPKHHKVVVERKPRERRSSYGMMIQFDGSYHPWLETEEKRCLLAAVDDATGDIVEAMFTQSERLEDVIAFWEKYFKKHGKPASIYIDRHASYKVNHPQDQFDEEMLNRFQRAMTYLGVEVIYAKSAEGKWRVENKFKLLQDRWIKYLRLAGVKDYDEAQKYLTKVIVPKLNEKFRVEARDTWDFHVPMTKRDEEYFERYFAKHTKRTINKVWVVQYMNKKYQIPVWQELAWTKKVTILESHLWNIQIRSWKICLPFTYLRS